MKQNFNFFSDKTKYFTKFYIPSILDIFRLEVRSEDDPILYYEKYDPFNIRDNIMSNQFFGQIEKSFYGQPIYSQKLENVNKS